MTVSLADDAALLSPQHMSQKLARLTASGDIASDYYGNGGAVAAFEAKIADRLGKERAVLFPTGTLANLCAMRVLAGPDHARILVQHDSHFFNDSGDNLAAVGGYTMVPLGQGDAGYNAADIEAEIARARSARVATRIGAIAIESPSRRVDGRRFGDDRIAAIAAIAKDAGIPLFLDGARMLIECAVTGTPARERAAPFDLVYVSLYKYLDAPFGCVLAGDAALLDDIFHMRRRYGGGLWQMWPAAILASDKLNRFDGLWADVMAHSAMVFGHLEDGPVTIHRFSDGTNAVRLTLPAEPLDGEALKARALKAGLKLPQISGNRMTIKFNESWLSMPPETLADKIEELAE